MEVPFLHAFSFRLKKKVKTFMSKKDEELYNEI